MKVPFLDLPLQYRSIQAEVEPAVCEVLRSGRYVLGPEVAAFETEFAAYVGTKFAIAVNTGTSALQLAILAAGLKPGDEVITVPHTFTATVAAILYTNAKPVFVDIDSETFTMDPSQIEAAITPKTKAIVPVHLYGQSADMDPILEIAKRRGLTVIEDAAQAHGASYKGRNCGSMGKLGCFSFYPGKNLGACGEGGAVTTDDAEAARLVRMLRDWGCEKKYHHELHGFNYRMDGIQGAILRIKLRRLHAWTEARRRHAATYDRLLGEAGLPIPRVPPHNRHVYHIYPYRTPNRDRVIQQLKVREIESGIHYPIPVHLQPAYAMLGYQAGQFPVSERIANEELSLPMFPELTDEQTRGVCEAVIEIEKNGSK